MRFKWFKKIITKKNSSSPHDLESDLSPVVIVDSVAYNLDEAPYDECGCYYCVFFKNGMCTDGATTFPPHPIADKKVPGWLTKLCKHPEIFDTTRELYWREIGKVARD